jgi:hypothetical protein
MTKENIVRNEILCENFVTFFSDKKATKRLSGVKTLKE